MEPLRPCVDGSLASASGRHVKVAVPTFGIKSVIQSLSVAWTKEPNCVSLEGLTARMAAQGEHARELNTRKSGRQLCMTACSPLRLWA